MYALKFTPDFEHFFHGHMQMYTVIFVILVCVCLITGQDDETFDRDQTHNNQDRYIMFGLSMPSWALFHTCNWHYTEATFYMYYMYNHTLRQVANLSK